MDYLMFSIKRFFKQLFCRHDYDLIDSYTSWADKDCWFETYQCNKCRKKKYKYYAD